MKFKIEIELKNSERCTGCPCLDSILDRCIVFYTELHQDEIYKHIRCKKCIKTFGK